VPELRLKRNFFLNKRRTSSIAGQESTFAVPRTFAQERRTFSTFFFYIGIAYSATLRKETCVLVKSAILSALLRRCHACPGVLVVAGKMAQIHVVFSRNRPVLVRTRLMSVFFGSSHAGFLEINENDL
jgi:hypothetical protein